MCLELCLSELDFGWLSARSSKRKAEELGSAFHAMAGMMSLRLLLAQLLDGYWMRSERPNNARGCVKSPARGK